MVRLRGRRAWLVFAVVLLLGVVVDAATQDARADGGTQDARAAPRPAAPSLRRAESEDVTVLAPRPVQPPSPAAAAIEAPPDLARFVGLTLAGVDVVVDDARWPDVKPPVVSVMRPGDTLTASLVRRAMDEALASGHFAGARTTLEAGEDGVRVAIHVMPRKVIDLVRADAHGAAIDADELLRDAELVTDGELVARRVRRHAERIEAQLARRGFPSPQVTIQTRPTDDPLRVVVDVDIQVGAPRRIERRVVYSIGGGRPEEQMAERAYAMKPGDRADEPALEAADLDLQTRARARGFLRAEVSHDVVMHRGFVVLRVRVDLGTRYETRYDGNDSYDKSTLDDALDIEGDADRAPHHLLQKIRDFYVKHGFLDVEVRLEDRGGPDDALHFLVFHVVEHQRVRVTRREYPCLREGDTERLAEGGPTSAKGIGTEIDSYLEEELPGSELLVPPRLAGVDATVSRPHGEHGAHPTPVELDPDTAYVPETYERAVAHVQELYRSEGFLSAQVGPVQALRSRCDPRSPPGECRVIERPRPPDVCAYDANGVPMPVPPLEPGSTCEPDPARGVTCSPRVALRIPVKLGPRTQLWDVAFSGVKALAPARLARISEVVLGSWVSAVKLDEARRRVADAYKEEGYAFVDASYAIELSPDRTRARARFTLTEGEKVFVRAIVVRGNVRTNTRVIEQRVALEVGQPYRASLVRKTQERVATLGPFASVSVALDDPYVPQRSKVVVVTVVEKTSQYVEPRVGFSTGEGFRLAAEYGHLNLWGNAVALTLRLQLAYIPTELIIDETARTNYRDLTLDRRIAARATGALVFPDVGLGPLVRAGVDALVIQDLQRDFRLRKLAAIPNANWRPVGEFQVTGSQSFEYNDSFIFGYGSNLEYLAAQSAQGVNVTDLVRQLLVPAGQTYALSQRLLVSWDRRDETVDAKRGIFSATSVEHVDAFKIEAQANTSTTAIAPSYQSHFFKLQETFDGYVPIGRACPPPPQRCAFGRGVRVASQTKLGANVQVTGASQTYPDRLFFLGGTDSMRGWNLNSFIPQDIVDLIEATKDEPDFANAPGDLSRIGAIPNPKKITPSTRPIRGGDLIAVQRVDLRVPLAGIFETAVFTDIGNLWTSARYPFETGRFPMRVDAGAGLRVRTPVGPLAVDYGVNLTRRRAYEDFGAVNFSIGVF